jgi:hypothetical protein
VDETYARIRGRWHYIYCAIEGRGQIVDAFVSPNRDLVAARTFFQRAMASSGTQPRRVITDKAGTYPPALATVLPGVMHRTGRYRTNGIERDHGFLKERLRPMRGLKSTASAAIFVRGHALMRNIRRGFYCILETVPKRLVLAWSWHRLVEACDFCAADLRHRSTARPPSSSRLATPLRCKRTRESINHCGSSGGVGTPVRRRV